MCASSYIQALRVEKTMSFWRGLMTIPNLTFVYRPLALGAVWIVRNALYFTDK